MATPNDNTLGSRLSRVEGVLSANVGKIGNRKIANVLDYSTFQDALTAAQANKAIVFVPIRSTPYIISGDLTLPQDVDLISTGATIQIGGTLHLAGGNEVRGIIFDGNLATQGMRIEGANTEILFNTFKNIKAAVSGQTNTINFADGIGDSWIFGNTFDNLLPYAENSITGDDIGTIRAIRIKGENVTVENNTFKNMVGFEDGDYIHVLSTSSVNSTFPYGGLVFSTLKNVVIKNNTFYQSQCKSSIKLQASGCLVTGNTFVLDNSSVNQYAVVRCQDSNDNIVTKNTFKVIGSVMKICFLVEYSSNCEFTFNNIKLNALTYGVNDTCSVIQVQTAQDIRISHNTITSAQTRDIFAINSTDKVTISHNIVKVTNGINNYIFRGLNSYTRQSTNLVFDNNTIVGSTDLFSIPVYVQEINGGVFSNTRFFNAYYNAFVVSSCTNVKITNSLCVMLGIDASYPVVINSSVTYLTVDGLRVMRDTAVTSFIRINNAVTNVVVSDLKGTIGTTVIYDTAATIANVLYKSGGNRFNNIDYGGTRPTCQLEQGHSFYDTVLGKMIWWNGTVWKDAANTTV